MAVIKSLRIMMYVDHSKVKAGMDKTKKDVLSASNGIIDGIAKLWAADKLKNAIVGGLQTAMKFERFTVEFAILGGNGRKIMKELQELAMQSPFPIEDWLMGGKRMLAAGLPAERLKEVMGPLADLAAGTGANMNELALVLSQVMAKGKLQGEEMLQFMERNVNLQAALQDHLGVTRDELEAMQATGMISPDDVIEAMKLMTEEGGKFYGMTQAAMMTLSGSAQALRNAFTMVMAEFGSMLIPFVGLLTKLITQFLAEDGVRGFFIMIATTINVVLGILIAIQSVLTFINHITDGWFGTIISMAAGLIALVMAYQTLVRLALILGVRTMLVAAWQAIVAVYTAITAFIMGVIERDVSKIAAGLAGIAAIAATVFGTKAFMDYMADQFNSMREDAEATAMAVAGMRAPKTAMFGSKEAYSFLANINAEQVERAQLEELRKIREAVEAQKAQDEADAAERARQARADARAANPFIIGNYLNLGS